MEIQRRTFSKLPTALLLGGADEMPQQSQKDTSKIKRFKLLFF